MINSQSAHQKTNSDVIHCMGSCFWWACGLVCSKYKPIDNSPDETLEIIVRPMEVHSATQTPIRPEMRAYVMYH